MAVLVIADHDNAHLRDTTHKTVTAAQKLSSDIDVLVLGKGAQAAADQAARIQGVRKVLLAEGDALDKQVAEAWRPWCCRWPPTTSHLTLRPREELRAADRAHWTWPHL